MYEKYYLEAETIRSFWAEGLKGTMRSVRLTILGYPGVGKSAITTRYMRSEWQDSYRPTIEERFTRDDILFRRERLKLTVTDTMGQDELADFKDGYCVASDGYVARARLHAASTIFVDSAPRVAPPRRQSLTRFSRHSPVRARLPFCLLLCRTPVLSPPPHQVHFGVLCREPRLL